MGSVQLDVTAGSLVFSWNDAGLLTAIRWSQAATEKISPSSHEVMGGLRTIPAYIQELVGRFQQYFTNGSPIGEIPWERLDQTAWTDFQSKVFRAISLIPHGETRSYVWLAERIRNMRACRAVGQALRTNPFPVLIPCHRIISKKGALGGFMGKSDPTDPELVLKKRLIEIEESFVSPTFPFIGLRAS